MGNNVACWHDCNAAFDYGFGADHEPKSEKMKNRKSKAEKNLGEEGLEKVKKNREFVESYEGVEMFDKELIEVRHDIDKGFHVVAKTDIPKGTIIIEEKAQFYAPLKYESHFPGSTRSLPLKLHNFRFRVLSQLLGNCQRARRVHPVSSMSRGNVLL